LVSPLYFSLSDIRKDHEADRTNDVERDEAAEIIIQEFKDSGLFETEEIWSDDAEFDDKDKLYGFTKVYGNEIDAHSVIKFVIDASKLIPERDFYLFDEGEAIYCPLIIKNGLAKPDVDKIKNSLEYWKDGSGCCDGGLWDITQKAKFYSKLVRNRQWTDVNKFVRPLKITNYEKKTKQVETVRISKDNIDDFPSIALDFLLDERLEQMRHYDDINYFPEEI
jgi:hypothetical protein